MTTYQETRSLDLLKRKGRSGGVAPITLRRGECGANIGVSVTYDGDPFDLTGYTAYFCAVNAEGEVVKDDATVTTAASGLVTYTVTSGLTAWAGPVLVAYVELTKSGEIATTDTLPFIVLDNADITESEAAAYQSIIDTLIAQFTETAEGYIEELDSVVHGYVISVGGTVDGENLVLGDNTDVDTLAEGLVDTDGRVADLEACCAQAQADLLTAYVTIAALSGEWMYLAGNMVAPNPTAMSVASECATVDGTVSGTTLTLESYACSTDDTTMTDHESRIIALETAVAALATS